MSEALDVDLSKLSAQELSDYLADIRRWQKKDFRQLVEDETLGRPEYVGFIYILSNPSMPGFLKIGYTTGTVEKRAAELSKATGVPLPYKIEKMFPVYSNPRAMERKVHCALDSCRVNSKREFFQLTLEDAVLRIQAAFAGKFDFLLDI
jgi:hypothetical protein